MKQIEKLISAENFCAVNLGKLSQLDEYVLEMGPEIKIPGKVFCGTALGCTGGEFSFLILFMLYQNGTMRFNSLRHNIPDISQKMLSYTLRTLEEDGYVIRKSYAEVPPRVEYSLSERGKSIIPHIEGLIEWAKNNLEDILKDRKKNSAG